MQAYHKGFTLIELVIVVVLLSILAAMALPKYMNFTSDARTAIVEATGGSFSAGLSLAHAKWEVNDTREFVDLDGDGKRDTQFSSSGWPIGISVDGKTTLSEIGAGGELGHDSCSQIMQKVINTTGLTIIAANQRGVCTSGDFCAKSLSHTQCEYTYRSTGERIVYDALTGQVSFKN